MCVSLDYRAVERRGKRSWSLVVQSFLIEIRAVKKGKRVKDNNLENREHTIQHRYLQGTTPQCVTLVLVWGNGNEVAG